MTDKKMNLNIDFGYDRSNDKEGRIPSNQQITVNYLVFGVKLGYKDGLPADKRRMMDSVMTRLEAAVKANEETFPLNSYEHLFFVQAFEKAVCPVDEVRSFSLVEKSLLEAKAD